MFSQHSFMCSLQSVKKRAYNLLFAVNDLFLFRMSGKCHLSINKQYKLLYSSSQEEESKRPSLAHRTEYKTFCICLYTEKRAAFALCYTWCHSANRKEILPEALWLLSTSRLLSRLPLAFSP